ncbi:hypothetical protein GCM10008957_27380 [Deinococcus ruber]|uniref:Uncharacterized protein n=1 Tax=Deinococcus ruber TaxID=1848197 RepID=A0A918CA71_9DEIO|nr:hypothetical protein GCM10008957_27380 [Deinococcus ruber]
MRDIQQIPAPVHRRSLGNQEDAGAFCRSSFERHGNILAANLRQDRNDFCSGIDEGLHDRPGALRVSTTHGKQQKE